MQWTILSIEFSCFFLKFGLSAERNSEFVGWEERMKVLFYVVFSLEHVARMEVRNFTEGLAMEFPQFQGLSSSTK